MALVFPSNPSVNDTYQVNGRTYVWNGTSWRTVKGGVPDVVPTLSVDNDFSAGGTLHIDSTSNEIGIGTGAPSHQLHLTQDLGVDGNLIVGGTITAPTPVAGTNDTKVATTAFVGDAVSTAVSGLLDGAPAQLDTLNELAAALDDDASYATTITNALALKLDSSSYTAADVLAKLITVDGTGSSLDADTLDGSHASAFAASSHTHSYAATIHTHSYHVAGGDYGTDFVGNQIFADNWFRAKGDTGLYFQDKGTGIRSPLSEGGQYGSVATYGNEGGWEGFSIGGRVVFMHDMSNNWGIYNDVNNEWMIYGDLNGSVDLYYNNAVKLYTDGSGVIVNGRLHATDLLYVGNNGSGDSWIYFYDDNSNAWREFGWDDSENRFRSSHNIKFDGYVHSSNNFYVGDNGKGDSDIYFYDDNSNTWRTMRWDDSVNDWRVEDNGGTMRTLYHSGNIPSYASSSHTHSYAASSHSHYIDAYNAGRGLAYVGATVGGGSANLIGFRWASPYVNCTVDNVIAAGAANFSDRRIKTDIFDSTAGMDVINNLRPVTYRPLDIVGFDQETGEPQIGTEDPGAPLYGFIADEVQEVIASAVRGEGIELKSIDSVQLLSVVVKAIQEIDSRLSALEAV